MLHITPGSSFLEKEKILHLRYCWPENYLGSNRKCKCCTDAWKGSKQMLLKPTSNLPLLLLLLCGIMHRDVKLLRRLKSVQLSTFPISKLENQSGIKLLEEVFMVWRGINMLLRDKFNQQLLYQLVKCAVWAQPQTSRCWGKSLSLCKLWELYHL